MSSGHLSRNTGPDNKEMLLQNKDLNHNALLAAIVQSSDDAIISKTLEGIVTSWNAAATRMFGYTADEMTGTSITRIIPPDRLNEEPLILDKLRQGLSVEHFETKRITKDHRILDISLTISPVRDKDGFVIGASKIARDITDQKAATRIIRESEERFRMAVASTRLGSWEYHPRIDRFIWTAESRIIWGFPEHIPPSFKVVLQQVHSEDIAFITREALRALDKGDSGYYNVEFRIRRYHDLAIRWVRVQGKVFSGHDTEGERFIGTVLDITDEKMYREELEKTVAERTAELTRLNLQLEKSNHELEQFAYIASHDLQEPLRKIQIFSELIREKMDDKEILERYFEKINVSARHMSRLIQDVLHYSRVTQPVNRFENVSLDRVLQEVLNEYDLLIDQLHAVVNFSPLPVIKGIPVQLTQLFRNLIGNALKFATTAPVIRVSARPATALPPILVPAEGRRYIVITVADNGIGFEQQYAPQLFEIFKRLNTHQHYKGTGVGLAICKKIVENHHGAITATGSPGNGAIFDVYLPLI